MNMAWLVVAHLFYIVQVDSEKNRITFLRTDESSIYALMETHFLKLSDTPRSALCVAVM